MVAVGLSSTTSTSTHNNKQMTFFLYSFKKRFFSVSKVEVTQVLLAKHNNACGCHISELFFGQLIEMYLASWWHGAQPCFPTFPVPWRKLDL